MTDSLSGRGAAASWPSMLDLVRLSPRRLFPPGGEALYRQIALLTGMAEGDEILDVGCGRGVSLEYFVQEHGAHGSGIEEDARLVQLSEDRARELGLSDRMHFQSAAPAALPYRDEIFDITVGELGMTSGADPAEAVKELVRVTRAGGSVVLVQLAWKAPVDPERRSVLGEHLGVQPLMLVEWKRLLKEAGVADLHTEDWTDDETAFRPRIAKPFPDFAEIFSLWEKLGILRRVFSRWGWQGVRAVLARERVVHRLLSRERILGLNLLMGTRVEGAVSSVSPSASGAADPAEHKLDLFPEGPTP